MGRRESDFPLHLRSVAEGDQSFAKATPSGFVEMTVDNPVVASQLVIGKAYYVDFTPIE